MIETLISIGLNEKEAQVYLELLKLGTQPASVIAKRLNIPKSTVNFTLEVLAKKNLASKTERSNTFFYTAEDPNVIVSVLEHQKSQQISIFNHKIDSLKSVVMELKSLQKGKSNKPKINFYEGDEGVKKIYNDTLTSTETIRSFACFDAIQNALPQHFESYCKKRAKNNIFIRSIYPDTKLSRKRTNLDTIEFRKSLLVPMNYTTDVQLYDNKISVASWYEKFGVIIESQEIKDAFVSIFELAWKEAERLNNNKL